MSAHASIFRPAHASWRARPAAKPDHPEAVLSQVARWTGLATGLARSAAEVALASWEGASWPADLISHACLLSDDGLSLVHYLQWRDEAPVAVRGLEVLLPGVMREAASTYHLYRSRVAMPDKIPGAVAMISYRAAGKQAAERFVEAMTDPALDAPAGLIGGHYHISSDGSQVLAYAEWIDGGANLAFRGSRAQGVFTRIVEASPGVEPAGGALYRPFARRTS
jgi:hypothetical protein